MPELPQIGPKTIVYGVFKGMGDLLNAAPVILEELQTGNKIKLLIFHGFWLEEFSYLLDFGVNSSNLEVFYLPRFNKWSDFKRFWSEMSHLHPDLIWISPHAPQPASSWKIPFALWFLKTFLWRHAQLAGADTERFSGLFDIKIPVDRDLSLMEREYAAFSMLKGNAGSTPPPSVAFIEPIRRHREEEPLFDLLIHPGANAVNRSWPYAHFAALAQLIPTHYRVAILGLPKDIEQARKVFPTDRGIQFLTGTLQEAIATIASSRVLFCMDSGNVHFANFLNMPAVALYGKSDPANIVGTWGSVFPIYEQKFPCQPCGKATCSQPEVYCMNSIAPETVAKQLLQMLESATVAPRSTRRTISRPISIEAVAAGEGTLQTCSIPGVSKK